MLKLPRIPHSWNLSPREAIALQKRMAVRVERIPPAHALRFVAGLDAAFTVDYQHCLSAVVLWDVQDRCVIEQHTAKRRLTFPYIPGLLSFREIPALLAALRKLDRVPDALMCDGHGYAHPRRFGIASHLGVVCDLPTIGCAKSRLTGSHDAPPIQRGSSAPLLDGGELIGLVLRTQSGVNPVYVSIGHKIDLATAERSVLECAIRYRLPEPTRLADQLVAQTKRGMHPPLSLSPTTRPHGRGFAKLRVGN
ncbi:MAG: deoxyribonuclease V [Candidatus Omnitrophica bacterium]|nr:deoxyribonuclease V [Candidatus Omnitrophota bacterium]